MRKIFRTVVLLIVLLLFGAALMFLRTAESNAGFEPNLGTLVGSAIFGNQKALGKIRELANQGDRNAQFELGNLMYKTNKDEAFQWYIKAADNGQTEALKGIERIAESGNSDAFQYLLKHAENNFAIQYTIANIYRNSKSNFYDWRESDKWFESIKNAASNGNPQAQFELGNMYRNAIGVPRDYEQALIWLNKAAEQNHPDALFILGNIHEQGVNGAEKNLKKAAEYYRRAAENGNLTSMLRLASMYEKGDVISQDLHEAAILRYKRAKIDGDAYWLRDMAKKGDAESLAMLRKLADEDNNDNAQLFLGRMYHYGEGVSKDFHEAFTWYRRAYKLGNLGALRGIAQLAEAGVSETVEITRELAENGDSLAQAHLGSAYINGFGVERDYNEALKWLEKSSAQNNALGNHYLALMYYHGWGVEQDYVKAALINQKALETGLVAAMNLDKDPNIKYAWGVIYRDGIEHEADRKFASILFHEAAAAGSAEANFTLGEMYEHGIDVEKNLDKAAEYYTNAELKAHPKATQALKKLRAVMNTSGKLWTELSRSDYDEFEEICKSGSLEKFREKMSNGKFSPNAAFTSKAWGKLSLLAIASEDSSNIEIVKFLIQSGAEVNTKENLPIIRATFNRENPKLVIQELIRAGADVNARDEKFWTVLLLAAEKNSLDVINLLIESGADVKYKDSAQMTALMYAAWYNTIDVIQRLLEAGCDINAQDVMGETALIKAAASNTAEVVEFLLNAGADPNITAMLGPEDYPDYPEEDFYALDCARNNDKLANTQALKILENVTKRAPRKPDFRPNAYISGNHVNIRENTSTSSRVITQLNSGHPVQVKEQYRGWFLIKTEDGVTGWVFAKYLRFRAYQGK